MFYKKKGTPEIDEVVLCTVKKILYHSVFVNIDEYENKDGMIHISEIAPGRIRNLRDYVKEEKRVVCKVLDINRQTGNIDLSLRRVSSSAMVQKLQDFKEEEKAEKLLEIVGREFKTDLKGMYDVVGIKAIEKYGSVYNFFYTIVLKGKSVVEEMNIPKNYKDALYKVAIDKIKPTEVKVSGILNLTSHAQDGIKVIKKILLEMEKHGGKIQYLGAPKYKVEVISKDYKTAETQLKTIVDKALEQGKTLGAQGEFAKSA